MPDDLDAQLQLAREVLADPKPYFDKLETGDEADAITLLAALQRYRHTLPANSLEARRLNGIIAQVRLYQQIVHIEPLDEFLARQKQQQQKKKKKPSPTTSSRRGEGGHA